MAAGPPAPKQVSAWPVLGPRQPGQRCFTWLGSSQAKCRRSMLAGFTAVTERYGVCDHEKKEQQRPQRNATTGQQQYRHYHRGREAQAGRVPQAALRSPFTTSAATAAGAPMSKLPASRGALVSGVLVPPRDCGRTQLTNWLFTAAASSRLAAAQTCHLGIWSSTVMAPSVLLLHSVAWAGQASTHALTPALDRDIYWKKRACFPMHTSLQVVCIRLVDGEHDLKTPSQLRFFLICREQG